MNKKAPTIYFLSLFILIITLFVNLILQNTTLNYFSCAISIFVLFVAINRLFLAQEEALRISKLQKLPIVIQQKEEAITALNAKCENYSQQQKQLQQDIKNLTEDNKSNNNFRQQLEQQLNNVAQKNNLDTQNLWEIIRSNTDILQDFLREIPQKIETLLHEFYLLQEQSANRGLLANLDIHIQQIKNHVRLLKFDTAINKCKKIEALSGIVRTKTGEIRLEQLVEMENHVLQLVKSLRQYHKFGQEYLEQLQKNAKNNKLSISGQRLSNIENHLQVLQRMIFSGDVYSSELDEFLKTTHKALINIIDLPPFKDKIIFEFCDVFDQVFKSHYNRLLRRQISWNIVHEQSRVLLYADCVSTNQILTIFTYMCILLAEKGSSISFVSKILPATRKGDWDILQIKTVAKNASKTEKTKKSIKKLFREYQKVTRNTLTELEVISKGFCLRFPVVVNKKFQEKLLVGIFGSLDERLSNKLASCAKFFPFEFEIVLNPTDCYNIDIAIADSKVLGSLSGHIYKLLQAGQHAIPLLIPVLQDEKDPITFAGEYYYLNLPVRKIQLRWLIFQCLDYIIINTKTPKIEKTIMFQRPPRQ
ncbi:hypothetical protein [Candidatus Uabimicrobium sp. HlEnr_7]|uniref:hypothetical protein n=1 Tax=Candidatus Uabimicrobium helgolandensis TaxID=3095367 RepID=UPI0035561583